MSAQEQQGFEATADPKASLETSPEKIPEPEAIGAEVLRGIETLECGALEPAERAILVNLKEQVQEALVEVADVTKRALLLVLALTSAIPAQAKEDVLNSSFFSETPSSSSPTSSSQKEATIASVIQKYQGLIGIDVHERLAVFDRDGRVVAEKEGETSSVNLTTEEVGAIKPAQSKVYKTDVHTHPKKAVEGLGYVLPPLEKEEGKEIGEYTFAPSPQDIDSLMTGAVLQKKEYQKVVVDPNGVWYLVVDVENPYARAYKIILEQMKQKVQAFLSPHIKNSDTQSIGSERVQMEEEIKQIAQQELKSYQKETEMINTLNVAFFSAKTNAERERLITEYIANLGKLGIHARYDRNDGRRFGDTNLPYRVNNGAFFETE